MIKGCALLAILTFSIVVIGLSAVNATDQVINNSTTNTTLNSTLNSTAQNMSKVTKQSTSTMKGYWMFSSDAANLNSAKASNLKNKGITDVFVCTRDVNGKYHYSELQNAIKQLKPYGIKVHAWLVCFKCGDKFIDPSGYYSYTERVYVKTTKQLVKTKVAYKAKVKKWYKSWYKSWYKYKGKWKYKWRYKWKYQWKYVTKYKYKNVWKYTPVYKYVKKTGYDITYNNKLVHEIASITKNYNIDGIHLDYVRYSGSASVGHAAYQQPGGTAAAVSAVTKFVQSVSSAINSTNKKYVQLSAALMPEGSSNAKIYGQDYRELANYLDFMVPMTYQGNYNANNVWITKQIAYIVNQSQGKPVYAGLTTYCSDSNLNSLSLSSLQDDVTSAKGGGASGFVLFRYGFGCSSVPK